MSHSAPTAPNESPPPAAYWKAVGDRILVAPLCWGLGHATRCIPLIKRLLDEKKTVVVASDGAALALLRAELPQLTMVELPPYDIRYPTSNMTFNMALQLPKMVRAVRREHLFLQKIIAQFQIETVISDNRYGCYSAATRNIFLTHQLNLQAPFGGDFLSAAQRFFIRPFDEIWIPDFATEPNLSGKLSHGGTLPTQKIRYIEPLTRMIFLENIDTKYDVAVVLSGPEPQRSLLETKIVAQALELPQYRFLLVQGLAQMPPTSQTQQNIHTVSYLTSEDLNVAIAASRMIIARAGYSTIMDLSVLQKKALLVPTPGQTEQEYLASFFSKKIDFVTQTQKNLNLKIAILKLLEM